MGSQEVPSGYSVMSRPELQLTNEQNPAEPMSSVGSCQTLSATICSGCKTYIYPPLKCLGLCLSDSVFVYPPESLTVFSLLTVPPDASSYIRLSLQGVTSSFM